MMKAKGYPESIIDLYERNPDAEQFAVHYGDHERFNPDIDVSGELVEGEIPHFYQWDERWGYKRYGDDCMGITGCGPTSLSMVICGLRNDATWNPYEVARFAERAGLYVAGKGTNWNLIEMLGVQVGLNVMRNSEPKADDIREALVAGKVVICSVGPGDFTDDGHFLVLTGLSEDGEIVIHDPFSVKNSNRTWSFDVFMPQVDCIWVLSTNLQP